MTKKSLALALAILMMLLAVGCGKKSITDGEGSKTDTSKTTNSSGTTTTPSNTSGSGSGSGTTQPAEPVQSFFPAEPKPTYQKVNLGPLALGTAAKVGSGVTITVTEKAVVTKATGLPPNYAYVVVRATVKNDSKEDYTINSTDHLKMETPEAKTMPFNIQATAQRSPRLQGTVKPGEALDGWLGYMVKIQPGNFKFKFTHPDWGDAYWEFAIN